MELARNVASLGRRQRFGLVIAAVAMAGTLGLAAWITPDRRGYGTHEQLGLPPCAFRKVTGVVCPSCGMTTSFAYLVRGQVGRAARVNLGGCALAVSFVGLIPWCLVSASVGRTIGPQSLDRLALIGMLLVLGLSLLGWAIRILVFGGQGWPLDPA
jgi:hypothetical protein